MNVVRSLSGHPDSGQIPVVNTQRFKSGTGQIQFNRQKIQQLHDIAS